MRPALAVPRQLSRPARGRKRRQSGTQPALPPARSTPPESAKVPHLLTVRPRKVLPEENRWWPLDARIVGQVVPERVGGVYLIADAKEEVIYAGESRRLRDALLEHAEGKSEQAACLRSHGADRFTFTVIRATRPGRGELQELLDFYSPRLEQEATEFSDSAIMPMPPLLRIPQLRDGSSPLTSYSWCMPVEAGVARRGVSGETPAGPALPVRPARVPPSGAAPEVAAAPRSSRALPPGFPFPRPVQGARRRRRRSYRPEGRRTR